MTCRVRSVVSCLQQIQNVETSQSTLTPGKIQVRVDLKRSWYFNRDQPTLFIGSTPKSIYVIYLLVLNKRIKKNG